MNIEQLKDFDNFYYYGQGDLKREIESDIHAIVNQNSRSLFYNRSNDSAGLDQYENTPNAIVQSVLIPYNIVSALSKRNINVGDGSNGSKDRRIAVSQNSVKIDNKENFIDVSIFYIALFDIAETQNTTAKFLV
jgi:hypothetical protein